MLRAVTFRTLTRVISLAALLLRYVLNMESSISQSLSVRCVCVCVCVCGREGAIKVRPAKTGRRRQTSLSSTSSHSSSSSSSPTWPSLSRDEQLSGLSNSLTLFLSFVFFSYLLTIFGVPFRRSSVFHSSSARLSVSVDRCTTFASIINVDRSSRIIIFFVFICKLYKNYHGYENRCKFA